MINEDFYKFLGYSQRLERIEQQMDSSNGFNKGTEEDASASNNNMNVSPISGEGGLSNPVSESSSSPTKRKYSIQPSCRSYVNLDNTMSYSKAIPKPLQTSYRYSGSSNIRTKVNIARKLTNQHQHADGMKSYREPPAFPPNHKKKRLLNMRNYKTDMHQTNLNTDPAFGPQHETNPMQ